MGSVQRFCDRAMLIDESHVVSIGNTHQIARQYLQVNSVVSAQDKKEDEEELGDEAEAADVPEFELVGAWMEDPDGEQTGSVGEGETIRFRVRVRSIRGRGEPLVGMSIQDAFGQKLFETDTKMVDLRLPDMQEGEQRDVVFEVTNYFAHGSYSISCTLFNWALGWDPGTVVHHRPNAWHMWSTSNIRRHGLVDLPAHAHVAEVVPTESTT
jgi:hypothetical protein